MNKSLASLEEASRAFSGMVWGLPLVFTLIGCGLFFSVYFGFPQVRFFFHSFRNLVNSAGQAKTSKGISPFQALCTSLSGAIGLGNIAGVAVALSLGGPGTLFWMWVAAVIGMATKFTSIALALRFKGEDSGSGPMITIKNGLSRSALPLAYMYSFFIILGAFGLGNMFQANQVAQLVEHQLGVPLWMSGLILAFVVGLVILGGIQRIGQVAGSIVPLMLLLYLGMSLMVVSSNAEMLPQIFTDIFRGAFQGSAAVGGFAGAAFKEVLIQGFKRAAFSNGAGMGDAAMAHSAVDTSPIKQALIGSLGPFIDTIIVCTLTALVLLSTGVWDDATASVQGAELTALAFSSFFGPMGGFLLTLVSVIFAFTTMIAFAYYGERGTLFIFGKRGVLSYRLLFLALTFFGAVTSLPLVINFSDACFALLAIPNLIANLALAHHVRKDLREYQTQIKGSSTKQRILVPRQSE